MTVEQIANRLGVPEQAITDALCMLGLPLPETVAEWPSLPDEERAALRARMPKRWQDRLLDAARVGRASLQNRQDGEDRNDTENV